MSKALVIIGIPFRLFIFVWAHILVGLLDPGLVKNLDQDWEWVVTGVDKYHRNNGRMLI